MSGFKLRMYSWYLILSAFDICVAKLMSICMRLIRSVIPRMELFVEQMKAGAGITEELKEKDQMKWVGLMNNVMSTAEEITVKELVYM